MAYQKLTDFQKGRVLKFVKEGLSLPTIIKRTGLGHAHTWQWLHDQGIKCQEDKWLFRAYKQLQGTPMGVRRIKR